MTHARPDVIKNAFDRQLTAHGLTRRSNSWYQSTAETICVLELQVSHLSSKYYLNLGVLLRDLDGEPFPKERLCHVRARWNDLVDEDQSARIDHLLDLESSIEEAGRVDVVEVLIRDSLIPLVSACSSLDSLRSGPGRVVVDNALVAAAAIPVLTG
ncbi:DUF4304 domain-containing protein [Tenggerimyces flavus]|uniref:DUF4304 domain-containing protein n=1 Tax=Tenggerimyces flavus TaxID=1708749 RepID=A0ABV7Y398_9ACTN|nr:DUF4304 domain-containing protein [Tenggerimyces flavus]MBM7790569.1 hypothetical protein [Tenggerimyces flavus]